MYANGCLFPSTTAPYSYIGRPDSLPSLGYLVPFISRCIPPLLSLKCVLPFARTSTCTPCLSLEIKRTNGAPFIYWILLKNKSENDHGEILFIYADMRRHPPCYVALHLFFTDVAAPQYLISRALFLCDPDYLTLG